MEFELDAGRGVVRVSADATEFAGFAGELRCVRCVGVDGDDGVGGKKNAEVTPLLRAF